ncbi:aminotransferase class I/II-fold pyridoxal phosphate-dependent enzyme [Jonesiaceae bacterium BS-20]|uniref:Aminotransferase n=1 Tax=Jonesiaceae bacterium BS-20 TaxID=3120821 RepID=A0AAU7DV32_9MICO
MKTSARSQIPLFAVMEILAAANARRAAGEDILSLCAGEPAAGASEVVRNRAIEVLRTEDLGYTEPMGVPALRQEIAAHYQRWYEVDVDPAQVAITTGSSGGFMLAFMAAFDPGDRVALARPGYPAYKNILTSLGIEVVELDCGPQSRYQPTVSQLRQVYYEGGLDGVIVASPANPTGTMLTPSELENLARWCTDFDVRLISDEIYHGITYTDEVVTATAAKYLDDGVVVVNSFSKYWAMTGWRLGWLLLPKDLIGPAGALAGNVALCPPALSQHAAIAAFSPEGYASSQQSVVKYQESRQIILDRLEDLGWDKVAPADGAFYIYANIAASGLDSVTWCARLLDEAGVAVTPGTDFDSVNGSEWVRLSFASSAEAVAQAIDRIVRWQNAL